MHWWQLQSPSPIRPPASPITWHRPGAMLRRCWRLLAMCPGGPAAPACTCTPRLLSRHLPSHKNSPLYWRRYSLVLGCGWKSKIIRWLFMISHPKSDNSARHLCPHECCKPARVRIQALPLLSWHFVADPIETLAAASKKSASKALPRTDAGIHCHQVRLHIRSLHASSSCHRPLQTR